MAEQEMQVKIRDDSSQKDAVETTPLKTQKFKIHLSRGKLFLKECYLVEKIKNMASISEFYGSEVSKDELNEITLHDCKVNIFAFKKLISKNSKRLKRIVIYSCSFYKNDNNAIKNVDQCSNNDMLRELALCSLIKTFELEQIEEVDIQLKKDELELNQTADLNKITPFGPKSNSMNNIHKNELIQQYSCKEDSEFIQFEINIKPELQKLYNSKGQHQALIENIIGGDLKKQIESKNVKDIIMINEIQQYVKIFNQYIKKSFQDNILIIKDLALENSISLILIESLIRKHKKDIRTIIFKEIGRISDSVFKQLTQIMLQIEKLESISFFSSQLDYKGYEDLNFFIKEKKLSYIVLNRSNFKPREVFSHLKPLVKYYSFTLIDLNYESFNEFTSYSTFYETYKQQIKLQYRSNEKQILDNQQDDELEIEILIKSQDGSSPRQEEMKKYINKNFSLVNRGQVEMIMLKYFDKLSSSGSDDLDQQELETDIKTLLRYQNPYSQALLKKLIQRIKDPITRKDYKKKQYISKIYDFEIDIESKEVLYELFLFEINLYMSRNKSYYLNTKQYINNTVQKKYYKFYQFDFDEYDKKHQNFKSFSPTYLNEQQKEIEDQLKNVKQFRIDTFYDRIQIFERIKGQESKQIFQIKMKGSYNQNLIKLIELLKTVVQDIQYIEVYAYPFYDTVHRSTIQIFIEAFTTIDKLVIYESNRLDLYVLSNVKKLCLNSCKNMENYFPEDNVLEQIFIQDCTNDFLKLTHEIFKNIEFGKLKKLKMNHSYYKDFRLFIHQILQSESSLKQRNVIIEDDSINLDAEIIEKIIESKGILFNIDGLNFQTILTIFLKHFQKNKQLNNQSLESSSKYQIQDIDYHTSNAFIKTPENLYYIKEETEKVVQQSKLTKIKSIKSMINTIPKIFFYFAQLNSNILNYKTLNMENRQKIYIKGDINTYMNEISDCCQKKFNQDVQNIKIETDPLKFHNGDICMFKTSIFKNRLNPSKIQIKFFQNFDLSQNSICTNLELSQVTKLDFSFNILVSKIQFNFIDFLIRSSPNLKKLKLKQIAILEPDEFQLKQINQNLEVIDVSDNVYYEIENILEVFKSQNKLKKINLLNIKFQNKKQNLLDEIIENNCDSLQKVYANQQFDPILKCKNLENLTIQLSENQFPLELFHEKLRNIDIRYNTEIQNKQLKNIMDCLSQYSNIQKIKIEMKNNIGQIYYNQRMKEKDFEENTNLQYLILPQKLYQVVKEHYYSAYLKQNEFGATYLVGQLQELYISGTSQLSYLDKFFEKTKNSLVLLEIYVSKKDMDESRKKDFFKKMITLPRSIKKLHLQNNQWLDSLDDLPVFKQNSTEYDVELLDVSVTEISLETAIKYLKYCKNIKYNKYYIPISKIHLKLLQNYTYDEKQQCILLANLTKALVSNIHDNDDIKQFFDMVFSQKTPFLRDSVLNQTYFISPNNVALSPYYPQSDIQEISSKQTLIGDSQIGDKYLFFLSNHLYNNPHYILGYSKDYQNIYPSFYSSQRFIPKDYAHYIEGERIFFKLQDYLLLGQMVKKRNVKSVHLPQSFKIDINLCKRSKISEYDLLQILNKIPPSQVIVVNMSIQFIKALYTINFVSPLFHQVSIEYNKNELSNNSVSNLLFLRYDTRYSESVSHKKNFKAFFQNIPRKFFKLFSVEPLKFRFDIGVLALAKQFERNIQKGKHYLLLIFFPIYLFVCVFGIVYLSLHFDVECGNGISWFSYGVYGLFGIITLFIELFFFKICLAYVSHLIPALETSVDQGSITKLVNKLKQKIIDTPWINQWLIANTLAFFQSQIARFDNFTNVGFLYSTYRCGDYTIFYIALCSISIPTLYSIFEFFSVIYESITKKNNLLTEPLDKYYKICNIISFQAVSNLLDQVSPSNTIQIKGSAVNVIGESIPLVIIQIYSLLQKEANSSLIISLVLSILTFLQFLYRLLTITPSVLNQEDFNMINQNKQQVSSKYTNQLQEYENNLFQLRQHDHLKKIRSQEYLLQTLKNQNQINQQEKDKILEEYSKLRENSAYKQLLENYFDSSQQQKEN